MGNRPTITLRSAAGTDHVKKTKCKKCQSNRKTSSINDKKISTGSSETSINSNGDSIERRICKMKKLQRVVAEDNAAALAKEYSVIESEWDSEFSTVSPSEMTTANQSKLLTPLDDQSSPFRFPNKEAKSTTDSGNMEEPEVKKSSTSSRSSLNSMDTWYGLPTLIETLEKDKLEAFTKPRPEDDEWVMHAHNYFDNEKPYTRKPPVSISTESRGRMLHFSSMFRL